MTTTVKDNGYKKFREQLEKLKAQGGAKGANVKVGILAEAGIHESDEGPQITVAQVAAYHEFGSPGANIPERSFMRSTLEEKKSEFTNLIGKLLTDVVAGKRTAKDALGILGLTVSTAIKKKIASGEFVPNSPATIAKKGSSKPLIDTGQLLNSISYEVNTGGEK